MALAFPWRFQSSTGISNALQPLAALLLATTAFGSPAAIASPLSVTDATDLATDVTTVNQNPTTAYTLDITATSTNNITLSGSTAITSSSTITVTNSGGGVLTGSGGLTTTGSGTLLLDLANTYTGATTVNNGTLQMGVANALSAHTALVMGSGATFDINNFDQSIGSLAGSGTVMLESNTLTVGTDGSFTTFSGAITGGGILAKVGTGTMTLNSVAMASGQVQVQGGALNQSSGSSTINSLSVGSQSGNAGTMYVSGGTLSVSTVLSVGDAGGTGNFYQSGGVVTINGSLTIGNESGKGTYTLFDGTLALSGGLYTVGRNSGANAVSTGSMLILGGVVDVQSGNLVIGNSISATGAQSSGLIQQSGGTVTIGPGAGLYLSGYGTGEYDLNGGILQVGGNSSLNANYNSGGAAYTFKLGGGTIQVLGSALTASVNATLVSGTTSTIDTNGLGATWSGALTGGGGLAKIGSGTLVLSGTNTYSGGTTIEAGTLQLGGANALPTGQAVIVSGQGVLDLNGHNASIGALSGTSGTVTIGGATLTLGTDNSSTSFGGVFTGSGAITKSGTGTLTLTGGSSAFTGATVVSAGELELDQAAVLGGSVTVKSGATIAGSGSINQNFAQDAGATMIVQASSSSASSLKVGGTAAIAGALAVEATAGQYNATTSYTILTATGGVTGTFGTVTSDLAFLTPTLTYSAQNIDLTLTRNASAFVTFAGTANQRSVGAALDRLSVNGPAAFTPFFNTVLSQTAAQATATLDHVGSSAQIASVTSSVALDAGQHFASSMMQAPGLSGPPAQYATSQPTRLQFASADPLDVQAQAAGARPKDSRWGAWATGDSINGKIGGDGNSADTNYNSDGEAFGIDYRLSRSWMIGISGGHVSTTASIDQLGASSKIESNSAGIYTGYRSGSLYATASVGYAYNDEQDTRSVVVEGLATSTATASPRGNQVLGAAEIGYDFRGPAHMTITPLVGVDASIFNQSGYTESGAGALDLTVASKTTKDVRTLAGAQIFDSFWLTDVRWLDLEMRGAWAHEVTSDDRLVSAQFAEAPGSGFVVSGARPKRDAALVGIGVATPLIRRISLYVRYDGDINGSDNAHGVSGGMRVTW